MMRFRASFQALRDQLETGSKENVSRESKPNANGPKEEELKQNGRRGTGLTESGPKEEGSHSRMPTLMKQPSVFNMQRGKAGKKDEQQEQPNERPGTPMHSLQGFLQRTKSSIRATGTRLEGRIPRRKARASVLKPAVRHDSKRNSRRNSKRNSQIQVRTYGLDEDVLDKIMGTPKDKKASESFLEKQRARVPAARRRGPSSTPTPQPISQADLDKQPLTVEQVQEMFIGAPLFGVEKNKSGYKPHVMFRGSDVETAARFPTDHQQFDHPAFKLSTLDSEIPEESAELIPSNDEDPETPKPAIDYGTEVAEVPSMLSAQGLDPGAVGFDHFLQLAISDNLIQPKEEALTRRQLLYTDPEWVGLRELNVQALITRLNDLGELYAACKDGTASEVWNEAKIEEMGEDLFGKLLSPDLGITAAGTGSVTMKTQMSALQKVLNKSNLWRDFTFLEWRIKVGQLLWAAEDFDGDDKEKSSPGPNERDILLLQITLAAELLVRIYAVRSSRSFPPIMSEADQETLERQRTGKVNWDLLLAERFLENLDITIKASEGDKKSHRVSLLSAVTFFSAKEVPEDVEQSSVKPIITPKDDTQALSGLLHFAESIKWPHITALKKDLDTKFDPKVKDRPVSMVASIYATPLSSPALPGTPGTSKSFFGFGDKEKKPGFSRTTTSQSVTLLPNRGATTNEPNFDVGGWLSRSWLSGLVMPGEAASHLLISTVLENSPQAVTALGDEANLYGGFLYEGRSFWSKSCIVGRVLAAKSEASECMGWVSVPGAAEDHEDGWVSLDVKEMPDARDEPRITHPEVVAKDSDLLHNQNVTKAQVGDFARPVDGPVVMGNEVIFEGLIFTTPAEPKVLKEPKKVPETSTAEGKPQAPPANRRVSNAAEAMKATEALRLIEAEENTKSAETVEAVESTEATESTAATEETAIPEKTDALETVKATEASDAAEPTETAEKNEPSSDTTEAAENGESAENAESQEGQESPESPEAPEATASAEEAEKPQEGEPDAVVQIVDDKEPTEPAQQPEAQKGLVATLVFSSPSNSKLTRVEMPLMFDAYFVSSYPCHPKNMKSRSRAQSKLQSASVLSLKDIKMDVHTPAKQNAKDPPRPRTAPNHSAKTSISAKTIASKSVASRSNVSLSTTEKDLPLPPTHPLHIEYRYDIVPAATLLGLPTESRPRAPSSPKQKQGGEDTVEKDVIVLDCRGSADLELFARAWCAKVGEHAVIGKTGRTCLACCVREARALGVCVVIRVD